MLSHNEAQALISASLDTPLDYDIEQVLAEHLAGCEECRLFAASSQRLASALRTMPTVPASPAVRQAVWSAIEQPDPWWTRVGGALSGRTAAMVSTAAIALLVIAFAALVFVRLTGTDDPDDEGARLAAGTEQAVALATETAEPTTTVAPTETTAPPTATAAAPTATTAPTETPPPTDEPTEEAAAPGVPTEEPVDLTGDGATEPTTEPEVTSEVVPALAEIAGTAIPTEEPEPTETPVPPTETPAPTETPVPPTQTPEPTATATPEPTETPAPVPALLTVTLVNEDNEPIGDACWVLIENEETVQESCDTPEVETPEFASNGNTGFFDVLPGTYTLRMISAPEGVSVEDREVEVESGRDDTVTITAEVTTPTPAPTETPEPTATPEPTQTPEPTETPVPTETPMSTETPVPTETPEPTQTPEPTPSPTETTASEPTEAPQATATREATSPPIQPVDDQAIEAESAEATQETGEPTPTDGTGSGPSDEIISPAEATAAVDELPVATETEESTEATIAQIIEPIDGDDQETTPAGAENGDGTQVITGEETPEAASTEETATSESTDVQRAGDGYDLSEAPYYSDGEPWGDVNARLAFSDGQVAFTDFPDSVSLDHEFLTVQTDSDGDSTYLTVCAEGCEPATLDSGDDGFTDSPIGWVDNQLIYQRQTGTGETELRALVWDGGVVSDEQIGSMSGTVTPLGRAYPGDNGTLIPTSEVWLLVTGGEATVIDENPFGDIRLARSNFNQALISYVAGGELIIADRSAPGTPVATLPFSGVDYDISPDLDRVVISTGNSLEIWSLGGERLGSSGTGTQIGSVLWLSSGIVMIDLSDTAIRLVDPAALVP